MKYSCRNCGYDHAAGEICEKTRFTEKEAYRQELAEKFDKFAVGYGETTTVVLMALRTKLFGETYEK